jgi:hypothetical protein
VDGVRGSNHDGGNVGGGVFLQGLDVGNSHRDRSSPANVRPGNPAASYW